MWRLSLSSALIRRLCEVKTVRLRRASSSAPSPQRWCGASFMVRLRRASSSTPSPQRACGTQTHAALRPEPPTTQAFRACRLYLSLSTRANAGVCCGPPLNHGFRVYDNGTRSLLNYKAGEAMSWPAINTHNLGDLCHELWSNP